MYQVCTEEHLASSLARRDIAQLNDKADVNDARMTLIALENRMATGLSLASLYDETRCHEACEFYSQSLQCDVKVWRVWGAGKIRVYFYYLPEKCILVLKIIAKRVNKLSKGQEKELKDLVESVNECLTSYSFSERLM